MVLKHSHRIQYEAWVAAKESVPRCDRCEDWQRQGLSSRCPGCDGDVLAEYARLMEGKKRRKKDRRPWGRKKQDGTKISDDG